MRADIPVPGSTRARLLEAAQFLFERDGYESASVTDIAAKAGVTTGPLYHHFGSKHGVYTVLRADLEKRLVERMAGAAESHGGHGPRAVRAALLVAFDAGVRFGVSRIVGEPVPAADPAEARRRPGAPPVAHPATRADGASDPIEATLAAVLSPEPAITARIVAAAWRAALLAVADGEPVASARSALEALLPR